MSGLEGAPVLCAQEQKKMNHVAVHELTLSHSLFILEMGERG